MDQDPNNTNLGDQPVDSPLENQPQTPISKEESMLQSAGQGMSELDKQPAPSVTPTVVPIKKSPKKLLIFIIVLLILGGIGFAAFKLIGGKKDDKPAATSAESTSPAVTVKENNFTPDKIIYAYREKNTGPYTIYYRPAAGGERKEVAKVEENDFNADGDAVGNVAVYISKNDIFLSSDSGLTFQKILTVDSKQQITSVLVSDDSTRVAVATVSYPGDSNTNSEVFSVDLKGADKKALFSDKESAIIIQKFSNKKQKIGYSLGCYNCDGPRSSYNVFDIKTKKVNKVYKVEANALYGPAAFSNDLSKFIYISGGKEFENPDGIGFNVDAPYKFNLVDIETGKSTLIDTVGKAGQKNANGTNKLWDLNVIFSDDSNAPITGVDGVFKKYDGTKMLPYYSSEAVTYGFHYASEKNFIISNTSKSSEKSEFNLVNYDVKTKKSTQILTEDDQTVIFGVTTK